MNIPLKIAIFRSGKTQRQIAIDARVAEGRLSDFVRGRAVPSTTERTAIAQALGHDYFADVNAQEYLHPAEARSR